MKNKILSVALCAVAAASMLSCTQSGWTTWKKEFASPSNQYRPQPFWHLNGEMTEEKLLREMEDAYLKDGFGGATILPVTATTPEFLSPEFFDRYRVILEYSKEQGREVVLYDDLDFPSGVAGQHIRNDYQHLSTRVLGLMEKNVRGPQNLRNVEFDFPGTFKGAVAMNTDTGERVNISEAVSDKKLTWSVPAGNWKIMVFSLDQGGTTIDYMDPEAVDKFIELTYDRYAVELGEYFSTTIKKTFYDDVGYYQHNNAWNNTIDQLFVERYGKEPLMYYPALWYDIGEETKSARVALYGIRGELMGSVFVKKVTEWADRHGLQVTGHSAGNYEPNTVEFYGNPFEFYKHQHIPLADMIHGYPHGRPGIKLMSSVGDLHNRGIIGVEIYGNYSNEETDPKMLYRAAMEGMARGLNFFIPHGMWLDPETMRIPPLIMHDNPELAPEFPAYNDWMGRSSVLLTNGRRVADIALVYPIQSLESWTTLSQVKDIDVQPAQASAQDMLRMAREYGVEIEINEDGTYRILSRRSQEPAPFRIPTERKTGRGKDVPPHNDYNKISDLLTNEVRRDFTFIDADDFVTDKYSVNKGIIRMNAPDTWQEYKLLIIPSSEVISADMLRRVKAYYESGGKVLFTGKVAFESPNFGENEEVAALNRELLGVGGQPIQGIMRRNDAGGKILYILGVTAESLEAAINELLTDPDVHIEPLPQLQIPDMGPVLLGVDAYRDLPDELLGAFSYIHKVKDGRDIYMFANSSNYPVNTRVKLLGRKKLEEWNPHTGTISDWGTEYVTENGVDYTIISLDLQPVSSTFAVSK